MKIRFEINQDVFLNNRTLLECYEYYEKYLKQYGFVLDKKKEEVFKEYNREIILNQGDRVVIDGIGMRIIVFKFYDIDDDIMTYVLEDE